MECTPVAEMPDDPSKWIYEVKLDGYRCCAVIKRNRAHLYSRYGNAWPERFPEIHSALAALGESMALDGEICAVDVLSPQSSVLSPQSLIRSCVIAYA